MITTESQEITMAELKERLTTMSFAARKEISSFLAEIEKEMPADSDRGNGVEAVSFPQKSFQEAKVYLHKNCDGLLRRLAQ